MSITSMPRLKYAGSDCRTFSNFSGYAEASTAITTAIALAPADSPVAKMARNEQGRLKQLAAGGATPSSAPKSNQPEPETVQPK